MCCSATRCSSHVSMQAAKVDAALSQPAAGAPAAGAAAAATATPAPLEDTRSPHELVRALAHSLHLHALLDAEFANGADASGPCWDALLALGGLEGVREFAVLRVRPAEPSGGVSRSGQGVTQHVVPLEVRLNDSELKSCAHGASSLVNARPMHV